MLNVRRLFREDKSEYSACSVVHGVVKKAEHSSCKQDVQGHRTKGGHREHDYELNCHFDDRNYWSWILEMKATQHHPCTTYGNVQRQTLVSRR